jgi:hypothetical protein
MKFNPFQPNKIVNTGMFVGRIDELRKIESYLYQTKSHNPVHFLVEGERGIGKSSLMKYVVPVAQGQFRSLSDISYKFMVIFVDLGGALTQLDIIRVIGRELRTQLSKVQAAKEVAKDIWDFLSGWEVLGVRYHKEASDIDPEDAKDNLVDQLVAITANQKLGYDGILIILDEADAPPVEAGLGELMKSVTEKLSRLDCDNVLFGLAGLPSVLTKLKQSHESSPRIFTVLKLDTLEESERKTVFEMGIEEANRKNDRKTKIDAEALTLLAGMSEGYPHFIQQFGYCAFEVDADDNITASDVLKGAHEENGAIAHLGKKYFSEMYFSKINSNDYRKLLDVMANYGDAWVSRRELISKSGLKEGTVNNALLALKQKSIIVQDESRLGYYRLPTKSFGAWVNAINSVDRRRGGEPTAMADPD